MTALVRKLRNWSLGCLREVLLLENVRFYKEEEKNDPELAKRLICERYIWYSP